MNFMIRGGQEVLKLRVKSCEDTEAQPSSLHQRRDDGRQRRDDRYRMSYVSRSRRSGIGSCSNPPLPAEPNFGAVNPFVV